MRLWAGLLAVGGGYLAAGAAIWRLQQRVNLLAAFAKLQLYLTERMQAGMGAGQALSACAERLPELKPFFNEFTLRLKQREQPFARAFAQSLHALRGMDEGDIELIGGLGEVLSRAQSTHDVQFQQHLGRLQTRLEQAQRTRDQNARLYRRLGLLCGLMIAVAVV